MGRGATGRLTAQRPRGLLVVMARETDDCFELLRRQGWSLGEHATATAWYVEGTRGGASFRAAGATQAEAWRNAAAEALSRDRTSRP
jgi:hypothetical protein